MTQNRDRLYQRVQRRRHINRKKRIIHAQNDYWAYVHDGEPSKGKIHCSCPMCRHKSYDQAKASDMRRACLAMDAMYGFGLAGTRAAARIRRRTRRM